MSGQEFSVTGETEVERRAFIEWKSTNLSSKPFFTCGCNVNYYKSVHHSIPTCGNREHSRNFQNKSVDPPFN